MAVLPLLLRCSLLSLLLLLIILGNGAGLANAASAKLMFVFGSSYGDTGNAARARDGAGGRPYPWGAPYGETWPGTASGRYSDGHVLSDVLAEALNAKAAVSYESVGGAGGVNGSVGVNFAAGGSGVLAAGEAPAIAAQVEQFGGVAGRFAAADLASAVVLYTTAGDDYLRYLGATAGDVGPDLYALTVAVGKQISADLIRLYQLGLRRFAVSYLPPTGCLPVATALNLLPPNNNNNNIRFNSNNIIINNNINPKVFHTSCNDTWTNNVALPHNARVFKNVLGLRHYFANGSIVNLDLFSAFSAVQSGRLQPCCAGFTSSSTPSSSSSSSTHCGSIGPDGRPAYSLCPNPSALFYWDDFIHPTQAAWQAVVRQLQPSLAPLLL